MQIPHDFCLTSKTQLFSTGLLNIPCFVPATRTRSSLSGHMTTTIPFSYWFHGHWQSTTKTASLIFRLLLSSSFFVFYGQLEVLDPTFPELTRHSFQNCCNMAKIQNGMAPLKLEQLSLKISLRYRLLIYIIFTADSVCQVVKELVISRSLTQNVRYMKRTTYRFFNRHPIFTWKAPK